MKFFWIVIFGAITIVNGQYRTCPNECTCTLDQRGRIQTICNKGEMTHIPVDQMNEKSEVLIIRGPNNYLTVGPVFQNKVNNLEIIRITDSNVPSVGRHSFWGLEKLRILGKLANQRLDYRIVK